MKKLNPCIFKGLCFFHALVFLVATSKLWFPLLNDNRVAVLSSTIIICIGYLIYDLIVNRPHIKENNNHIQTKAGDLGMVTTAVREGPKGGQRGCELGLRRRQAYGETERVNKMNKIRNEIDQELGKFAGKMKEEQERSTTRKEINFSRTVEEVRMRDLAHVRKANKEEEVRMRDLAHVRKANKELVAMRDLNRVQKANKELVTMCDLDRVQKANKELVAKLEEVEKDKNIAVESNIKLMKILDEVTKKVSVSCFDHVQNVNKELVAKLEEAEKDKKIVVESKIKLMKILDEETKKVWCLDHVQKVNKELAAKLEKVEKDKKIAVELRIELMKILDEEEKKISLLEKKCVNLEKGIESHRIAYRERETSYRAKIPEEEKEKNRALEEEVNKKMLSLIDLIANRKDGFGSIMKIFEKERDKCKMLSDLIECKRLEKAEGTEAEDVKNKLKTRIPVDENTYEYEDVMLGSEDDIVYVDSDGFEIVENF